MITLWQTFSEILEWLKTRVNPQDLKKTTLDCVERANSSNYLLQITHHGRHMRLIITNTHCTLLKSIVLDLKKNDFLKKSFLKWFFKSDMCVCVCLCEQVVDYLLCSWDITVYNMDLMKIDTIIFFFFNPTHSMDFKQYGSMSA